MLLTPSCWGKNTRASDAVMHCKNIVTDQCGISVTTLHGPKAARSTINVMRGWVSNFQRSGVT